MTVRVADQMTTRLVTVAPDTPVTEVLALMHAHHIRHLPVVDADGGLRGLITDRDLLGRASGPMSWFDDDERDAALAAMRALEVMTDEVTTVTPTTALADAGRVLLDRKVGCVPVVDGDRLVGIVTEADFVAAWVARGDR